MASTRKKSLGQNFLSDSQSQRGALPVPRGPSDPRHRISKPWRGCSLSASWVYEVGPGPGGLTRALLMEGADVLAIERDERAETALAQIAAAVPGRGFIAMFGDAMAVDERSLLDAKGIALPVPVAANLPYNLGSALLVKWLTSAEWPPWWSSLTLMFQREVALRICAKPGEEGYGRLSVLAQWRADAKLLFDVHPSAFVPPPKVTSTVIRIDPLPQPRFPAELAALEKVTAAAFGQRRKMLRGSLKQLTTDAGPLLQAVGIDDGTRRAEELSLEEFCALARAYAVLRRKIFDIKIYL